MLESSHQHPAPRGMLLQNPLHRGGGPGFLDLEDEGCGGKLLEHISQAGDALPGPRIHSLQLCCLKITQPAPATRGSVQRRIVQNDRDTVRRRPRVQLQRIGPLGQRGAERQQRVFRLLSARTPVSNERVSVLVQQDQAARTQYWSNAVRKAAAIWSASRPSMSRRSIMCTSLPFRNSAIDGDEGPYPVK